MEALIDSITFNSQGGLKRNDKNTKPFNSFGFVFSKDPCIPETAKRKSGGCYGLRSVFVPAGMETGYGQKESLMFLSKHFIENWHERVGSHPTESMVQGIIHDSVRVRQGMKLKKQDNTPFNTLSIYWHPDLKLVILVDRFNDRAVSVLSRTNAPCPDRKTPATYYTPMTMHGI